MVLITDNDGERIHHNTYDEYGRPHPDNEGRFQYTGQTWLSEAELYYYKSRVYNPYLGRFHQSDPIGYVDGMNLYAYVGNDPLNFFDPTGMSGCSDTAQEGLVGECVDSSNFRTESEEGLFGTKAANDFSNDAVGSDHTDNAAAIYGQVTNQQSGNEQAARIDESKYGATKTTDIELTSSTPTSSSFPATAIEGAEAMVHTHPTDSSTPIPGGDSAAGDWGAPSMGVPNYAVHGDKVVMVVEISGGQIRARIVKGSINSTQRRSLRRRLNQYQKAGEKH